MHQSSGTTDRLDRLLQLAARNDHDLYAIVIELAAERLQALTRRMLRDYPGLKRWEETDDVFQTAVIRLHRSLSEVKPDSFRRFMGLAATQIRRTLIDLVRHHFGPLGQHTRFHSDGLLSGRENGALQQAADSFEPSSLHAWASFHEAVEMLPDELREVFELTWYTNLSQGETAVLLEISVATVKRRWRSAQLRLGAQLDPAILISDENRYV